MNGKTFFYISGSVKILTVSRNPYEMVLDHILMNSATSGHHLSGTSSKNQLLIFNNETKLYTISPETFSESIKVIQKRVERIHTFLKTFNVKIVHADDFFAHSKLLVVELCAWLNLECLNEYKDAIGSSLKTVPRQLRENFSWPKEISRKIDELVKKYPNYFLQDSDFLLRNL